jgi:hypothetical protein
MLGCWAGGSGNLGHLAQDKEARRGARWVGGKVTKIPYLKVLRGASDDRQKLFVVFRAVERTSTRSRMSAISDLPREYGEDVFLTL